MYEIISIKLLSPETIPPIPPSSRVRPIKAVVDSRRISDHVPPPRARRFPFENCCSGVRQHPPSGTQDHLHSCTTSSTWYMVGAERASVQTSVTRITYQVNVLTHFLLDRVIVELRRFRISMFIWR